MTFTRALAAITLIWMAFAAACVFLWAACRVANASETQLAPEVKIEWRDSKTGKVVHPECEHGVADGPMGGCTRCLDNMHNLPAFNSQERALDAAKRILGMYPPRCIPAKEPVPTMPSPCPALASLRDPILQRAADRHAEYMAAVCVQGHQGWEHRAAYLRSQLGPGEYAEICAESWKRQRDCSEAELWVEMVRCWKQSPDHWRVARVKHKAIGAAMALGRDGRWFAVIIARD